MNIIIGKVLKIIFSSRILVASLAIRYDNISMVFSLVLGLINIQMSKWFSRTNLSPRLLVGLTVDIEIFYT